MRIVWDKEVRAELIVLSSADREEHAWAHGRVTSFSFLRIGDVIAYENCVLQLVRKDLFCGEDGLFHAGWNCRVLEGNPVREERDCFREHRGLSLAWITLSDKGARGERKDVSGPAIREIISGAMEICLSRGMIIPDEPDIFKHILTDFCLFQGFDLVITTGGTGVGPRDITPDVTCMLLDKRLPGFEQAMMAAALKKTPHGVISRAVAGTMGLSLVINLPGSLKAVRENLLSVLPAIRHTIEKLQGDEKDCGIL